MKRLLLSISICVLYLIMFFIVVPFAAFPLTYSELNDAEVFLNGYNQYDFSKFEIVDTKTLPYSTLFLLHDIEHQELLLLQAEKYPVYSRYRFILNPQRIFSDRSMAIDDFVYRMDVKVIDRRLVVDQRFLPDLNTILVLFWGLIFIFSLIRSVRMEFIKKKNST